MTSPQVSPATHREPQTNPGFTVPPGMRAFGWAGWWLPVPESFRLHDIDGNGRRGRVALADAERMRLELAWDAVTSRSFDGDRFARKELLRGLKRRDRSKAEIHRVENAWFQSLLMRTDHQGEWNRYAGFCPVTRRALVIRYRPGPGKEDDWIANSLSNHLRGQSLEEGQRWAFFSVSFLSPPRFEYEQATLNLGDMSVQLVQRQGGRQPRVVVRQIHPAKLALSRFNLAGWLEHVLVAESRTYQPEYRKRFPRRDPVMEEVQTLLGPCVAADSRLRASLRVMLSLRHHRHRRTWLIHDEAGDRLVLVQVSHVREQLQPTFETVLRGLHRADCNA